MSAGPHGHVLRWSLWAGEAAAGALIDGCPPGIKIDDAAVGARLLSGLFEGRTTGTPIALEVAGGRDRALLAAGEVARKASDEELAELKKLHAQLEAAVKDRDKFFAINERFHMRLLEIAGNRWRMQMVADLRKVMKLNRHNSLLKSGRVKESLLEHREVMAAIEKRNASTAVRRMQEHFNNGLEAAS